LKNFPFYSNSYQILYQIPKITSYSTKISSDIIQIIFDFIRIISNFIRILFDFILIIFDFIFLVLVVKQRNNIALANVINKKYITFADDIFS
jgi:hypothetical protein